MDEKHSEVQGNRLSKSPKSMHLAGFLDIEYVPYTQTCCSDNYGYEDEDEGETPGPDSKNIPFRPQEPHLLYDSRA